MVRSRQSFSATATRAWVLRQFAEGALDRSHHARREGRASANLWRMDADGSNLKRLTEGEKDVLPVCSTEGKWVYYTNRKANRWMRVPLEAESQKFCRQRVYLAPRLFPSPAFPGMTGCWLLWFGS